MSATKFTTFDINGIKEDVSDIISRISPEATPFTKAIRKTKIHDTVTRWQEIALKAPDLNNAAVQGAEFVDQALTPTLERSNRTQILTKVINVAETTDAVAKYGRADELGMQFELKATEAKTELEAIMLGGQSEVVGSSNVASRMASVQAQIAANNRIATGGANVAPTKQVIKDTMIDLRTAGARCTDLMIHVSEADVPGQWLTETAGQFVRQVPNSGEASHGVTDYVDYVITPTGRLDISLNDFILATDYLVYSPKNFSLATLRPWKTVSLAKTSDSNRLGLVGEFTVTHANYNASAVIRKVEGTNGKF